MIRFARAAAAVGLALTAFGAMALPASAQGTVRGHGGPPAPKPTVDRDHRTQTIHFDEVTPMEERAQWETTSPFYVTWSQPLYNARRDSLRLSSGWTFRRMPSGQRDRTGWGTLQTGAIWAFKQDPVTPLTPAAGVGAGPPFKDGTFYALWNKATDRYLDQNGQWSDKPLYIWMLKDLQLGEGARGKVYRFALYNILERKYLMLCHSEKNAAKNREELCYYDASGKPS